MSRTSPAKRGKSPKTRTSKYKPSSLERVAGSLPVAIGATAIAAGSGTLLAPLLPVFVNALAQGRAEKRILAALNDVQDQLDQIRDRVHTLPDEQYRLVAGIVGVMLETVDEEKLRLLKAAVLNVANCDYLSSFEAQLFARIVRDISAAEVRFLAALHARSISFANPQSRDAGPESPLYVNKKSTEGALAVGLINLGLIVRSPSEGHADDIGEYFKSPIVDKLLRILSE